MKLSENNSFRFYINTGGPDDSYPLKLVSGGFLIGVVLLGALGPIVGITSNNISNIIAGLFGSVTLLIVKYKY